MKAVSVALLNVALLVAGVAAQSNFTINTPYVSVTNLLVQRLNCEYLKAPTRCSVNPHCSRGREDRVRCLVLFCPNSFAYEIYSSLLLGVYDGIKTAPRFTHLISFLSHCFLSIEVGRLYL